MAANAMKFRSVGRNQIDQVANMLQCFFQLKTLRLHMGHSDLLSVDMQHANHSLVGWIGCRALENAPK